MTTSPSRDDAKLLHNDRLAAMGQLAAGVAHEVNNPAAFVSANMAVVGEHASALSAALRVVRDLVRRDEELASRVERVLAAYQVEAVLRDLHEIVNENLDGMGRIASIVRGLSSFSRVESDPARPVHPNEIVNAACNLVNTSVRHRARLVKELGETPRIVADAGRMIQVLTNLLLNAAQAIPETSESPHHVYVRTRHEGGRVVFEVEDDGSGMSDEVMGRIYEPFFTTKPRGEGTGLGLSLAKQIVVALGGDIDVKSEVGRGTTFTVRIPALEDDAVETGASVSEPPLTKVAPPTAPVHGARALVVDDDPMVLRAYRRALGHSLEVVCVDSGEQAISLLSHDANFDVILCDLMMPRVDGEAVFEEVRAMDPSLGDRFIFVSGGAFSPRAQRFLKGVGNPFLEKPVAWPKLGDTVAQMLRRS